MGELLNTIKETLKAYPLEGAQDAIRLFTQTAFDKGLDMTTLIRAYSVKQEDVGAVLGIEGTYTTKYTHFRAYIGMTPVEGVGDIYKLFLVPIDENGKDVIFKGPSSDYPFDGYYVYDFNTPCPNTCDPESPLFQAGIQPRH